MRGRSRREERGETLVEVLVAVAILGIAGVAIIAGFGLSVKASTINRNQANSGSYVKSTVEAVQNYVAAANGNYRNCAGANWYTALVAAQVPLPTGYSVTQAPAQSWTGTGWGTCTTDNGVQRVQINVKSIGDGSHQTTESLYVVLRKACTGAVGSACS